MVHTAWPVTNVIARLHRPDQQDWRWFVAEATRRHDFLFQIIVDYPGGDAERVDRVQISALPALAEIVLALDLDVVERWVNSKRSILARCMSAAPLVTSASLTPSAFSRSTFSCAPGKPTSPPRGRW